MNNSPVKYILHFFFIALLQILLFKQIPVSLAGYHLMIFIYPVFILTLPVETPKIVFLLLGFFIGIFFDAFYDSLGVHAGAAVFSAYFRNPVLQLFGVDVTQKFSASTPAQIGWGKFMRIAGVFLFAHIFVYYVYDVFTFVYLKEIILKTVGSFILSYPFVLSYSAIMNLKND